jgi:hypothetical protein
MVDMRPPTFLNELVASIKARRHRRQKRMDEEGAQISRRLQELLGAPESKQVETLSKASRSESDQGDAYRDGTGT